MLAKPVGDLPRGAVIMPALNEAAVISNLISDIKTCTELPVWVIDDQSTDNTALLAEQTGAKVFVLPHRLGAWGATQTGIRQAANRGMTFVVTMDADGQHHPSNIPALMRPVLAGECDVAIGSSPQRGSGLRKFAWRLMRLTSGLKCTDITSGFRALNADAISLLAGKEASGLDYQDVGVLLLMEREGLRIAEVPVEMPPRVDGHSRIFSSWFVVFSYMAQTLILGLFKRRVPWRKFRAHRQHRL